MSQGQITTGQDSFLDIVANLVGILIILVVVVSAQASTSWSKPKPRTEEAEEIRELASEASRTKDTVRKLRLDNQQLEEQLLEENRLAADLTDQRHVMLVQLEIAKQQIELKRQQRIEELEAQQQLVDDQQREEFRRRAEFAAEKIRLERELEEIEREADAVKASTPKSETIEHFPNPIAKTVFSEEVHFRLLGGKLAYVPMDELIGRMKTEWKVKAEKLGQASRTVETVGPISNFRMQYELATDSTQEKTSYGVVDRQVIRFKHFTILPLATSFGETIDEATMTGSNFQEVLSRHEAQKTTVSIWVYPDSYHDHNRLKNWLHEHGYQIASWPLDVGKKISGGPNGFKTSAQ